MRRVFSERQCHLPLIKRTAPTVLEDAPLQHTHHDENHERRARTKLSVVLHLYHNIPTSFSLHARRPQQDTVLQPDRFTSHSSFGLFVVKKMRELLHSEDAKKVGKFNGSAVVASLTVQLAVCLGG